jgi:hypothetical protein
MSTSDRDYISGATVKLTAAIRDPLTRAPKDPPGGVFLDALVLAGEAQTLPDPATFTKITPGEYVFALDTVGFVPGAYTWRAKAIDENGDVALAEDTFVVRAYA